MSTKDETAQAKDEPESGTPAKRMCLEDPLKSATAKDGERLEKKMKDELADDLAEDTTSNTDEKLKLQQQESTRRENVLVMRLATKEQEMQDLMVQIHELKQAQTPSTNQLRSTLIDPAVNLLFETMKNELDESNKKLEQAQNDLNAWKFTPDSVTGKKLMAKCRMLFQENQDLGKQLSQGRVAQLEAELALQRKYGEELKSSQDEMNDFVIQLDEEVEGLQSTIYALQQELKETKQTLTDVRNTNSQLESEVVALKSVALPTETAVNEPMDTCVGDTELEYETPANEATEVDESATVTVCSDGQPTNQEQPTNEPIEVSPPLETTPCDNDTTTTPQTTDPISPVYMVSSFSISTLLTPEKHRTDEQQQAPDETPEPPEVVTEKPSNPTEHDDRTIDPDDVSCNGETAYDEQLSPTV